MEREVEDIAAVIDAAGGSAFLYGTSSGAALALEAAASGRRITKLALWEPPYIPEGVPSTAGRHRGDLPRLVGAGRRGDAVEFFMSKVVGMPDEFVAQARQAPFWAQQEALAHTLAYDADDHGGLLPAAPSALPPSRSPRIVMAGAPSLPWMSETARALADAIPNGQFRTLEGQTHDVSAEALAPVLEAFLDAES